MKEKSRLTISFEILKNPHIELHDKIVYSVIATLMVDVLRSNADSNGGRSSNPSNP